MMYNLGSKKMLIQNTLGVGKSYVYELPSNEYFLDFVEYQAFQDIGFYPVNLRIEMCSNFAFLTQKNDPDKKTK